MMEGSRSVDTKKITRNKEDLFKKEGEGGFLPLNRAPFPKLEATQQDEITNVISPEANHPIHPGM